MKDLGLPDDTLTIVKYPTRFDCREALSALRVMGVCPKMKDYAWRLEDDRSVTLTPICTSTARCVAR